jgi:hypothetical protein
MINTNISVILSIENCDKLVLFEKVFDVVKLSQIYYSSLRVVFDLIAVLTQKSCNSVHRDRMKSV